MPKEKLTIGQYIRQERINYMSLRSFAKELGVSASYLSDIELDRRKVSRDMVERIATTFQRVIGGKATVRYVSMLRLAGLLTPEHECLLEVWDSDDDLGVDDTLKIFNCLFRLDLKGGAA